MFIQHVDDEGNEELPDIVDQNKHNNSQDSNSNNNDIQILELDNSPNKVLPDKIIMETDILDKFLGIEIDSCIEDLLKSVAELVEYTKTKENRENLDTQIFQMLSSILTTGFEDFDKKISIQKLELLSESFRFLRNSCIESRLNQDRIRTSSEFLFLACCFIEKLGHLELENNRDDSDNKENSQNSEPQENEDEDYYLYESLNVAIRCTLQFLGNFFIQNKTNCCSFKKIHNLIQLLNFPDELIFLYTIMNLTCLIKFRPQISTMLSVKILTQVLNNLEGNYSAEYEEFITDLLMNLQFRRSFYDTYCSIDTSKNRLQLVKIMEKNPDICRNFEIKTIEDICSNFKDKSQQIIDFIEDKNFKNALELMDYIDLVLVFTEMEIQSNEFFLRKDNDLFISCLSIFKSIHKANKEETIKLSILKLIRDLSFRCQTNQNLIREQGCLLTILLDCKSSNANYEVMSLSRKVFKPLANNRIMYIAIQKIVCESNQFAGESFFSYFRLGRQLNN